jgi:hypothetical protein
MARSNLLRWALCGLSTLSLVACSSASSSDDAIAKDDDLREGGVCSTIDYGHTQSNEDYFKTFADDASAIEYAKGFLEANAKPPPKEISHDARMLRLVDEVYRGFQKVFPKETAGFATAPRIVIVESDAINAFAGFDDRPEVEKAPWLFFVHSSILERDLGDSELRGLFVHELAHLILRNVLPETRAKIRVHYRAAPGAPYAMGNIADDDARIRARAEELRRIGEKVGRFPALAPFPMGVFAETDYKQEVGWFRGTQREASPNQEACTVSDQALIDLNAFVQAHASAETYSVVVSAAEKPELERLIAKTQSSMKDCYGHVKMSLFEARVRTKLSKLPADQATPLLAKILDPATPEHAEAKQALLSDDIEREVDARKDLTTIERVFAVVDGLHKKAAALEADKSIPIDEMRVFDMEEDADDAAVRVLRAMGDDPLGNAHFLLSMLSDRAACEREVASGKEPTYGRFVDPHNGTCWRYHHSVQLAKALERCPAPDAKKRNAKGTGEASPADKPASELLEKGHAPRIR